jgi:hypothetical protein
MKPKRMDAAASSISAIFLLKYASTSALELSGYVCCQKQIAMVARLMIDIVRR